MLFSIFVYTIAHFKQHKHIKFIESVRFTFSSPILESQKSVKTFVLDFFIFFQTNSLYIVPKLTIYLHFCTLNQGKLFWFCFPFCSTFFSQITFCMYTTTYSWWPYFLAMSSKSTASIEGILCNTFDLPTHTHRLTFFSAKNKWFTYEMPIGSKRPFLYIEF